MIYCNLEEKPEDIPTYPKEIYSEFVSWNDWLDTEYISSNKIEFRSFEEAREFTRKLKLTNTKDWAKYAKSKEKPVDIPSSPDSTYKEKFVSWGDWLGNDGLSFTATWKRKYRSFTDAKKFALGLNLKDRNEWFLLFKSGKIPEDIPRNADRTYRDEFLGWGDFLGTGNIAPINRKRKSKK